MPPPYICEVKKMPFNAQPRANITDINKALEDLINNPTPSPVNTYTRTQIDGFLAEKVDKEQGKGLSTNDFTNEYKAKLDRETSSLTYKGKVPNKSFLPMVGNSVGDVYIVGVQMDDSDKAEYIWTGTEWEKLGIVDIDLSGYVTQSQIPDILALYDIDDSTINDIEMSLNDKVDKESGKGLSTNDFTTNEKNKLAGLQNYDDTNIVKEINDIKDIQVAENLIKFPYKSVPANVSGATLTVDENGVLTLNGTATKDSSGINLYTHFELEPGVYTISANSTSNTFGIRVYGLKDGSSANETLFSIYGNDTRTFIVGPGGYEDYIDFSINGRVGSAATFNYIKMKPMLEKGPIAHEYQPYKLSRVGLREDINSLIVENFVRLPHTFANATQDQVNFEAVENGGIRLYGTRSATSNLKNAITSSVMTVKPGETYTLSVNSNTDIKYFNLEVEVQRTGQSSFGWVRSLPVFDNQSITFTTEDNWEQIRLVTNLNVIGSYDVTFYPMLEEGTVVHSYKPYNRFSNASLREDLDRILAQLNLN